MDELESAEFMPLKVIESPIDTVANSGTMRSGRARGAGGRNVQAGRFYNPCE